jgi:RNA polymerase sigma-70 factor (ECF subfamily)
MQETFLRVRRRMSAMPRGNELPWMYRIATNYCLNELRNRKTRTEARSRMVVELRPLEEQLGTTDHARRVLQRLPARTRQVAWLHYAEGMNQDEVATALGISRRTVVKNCQTARFRAARASSRAR